jgi:hypothetical protein
MGRRPLGKVAMTVTERSRRHRLKHPASRQSQAVPASAARPTKRTYRHATVCPHCSQRHELLTSWHGSRAAPGDACLCIGCGRWSVVADHGKLRLPLTKEL